MNRKLLAFSSAAALFFTGAGLAESRGENLRVGVSVDAKNFDPCNLMDTYSFSMQK